MRARAEWGYADFSEKIGYFTDKCKDASTNFIACSRVVLWSYLDREIAYLLHDSNLDDISFSKGGLINATVVNCDECGGDKEPQVSVCRRVEP